MPSRSEKRTGRAITFMGLAFLLIFYLVNMPEINTFVNALMNRYSLPELPINEPPSDSPSITFVESDPDPPATATTTIPANNPSTTNAGAPLSPIFPIISLIFTAFIMKKRKFSNNE